MSDLNFVHNLPDIEIVGGRHPFIVDFCKGKNVLHVGCVDSGLLLPRFEKNELLHQKLDKVANCLYGIDIDKSGIEFLEQKGFKNLYTFDICSAYNVNEITSVGFDVIVLSEVLEHLDNVGKMLQSLKGMMTESTDLLISVPNAFNFKNIWNMIFNRKYVHPDHNYYFSYYTINNIVMKNGFKINLNCVYSFSNIHNEDKLNNKYNLVSFREVYWCLRDFISSHIYTLFEKVLFSRSKYFSDGIFVVCRKDI